MSPRRAKAVRCAAGVHGDLYAYRHHGCRCPAALRARGADSARARRAAGVEPVYLVPAGPTVVLLQLVLGSGYTQEELAGLLGCARTRIGRLLNSEHVHAATAARVAGVVRALLIDGRQARQDADRRELAAEVMAERFRLTAGPDTERVSISARRVA